ncbi:hypothetical protein [Facklamia sp. 7083-14-GEN3]|uniref:hypothetical protein n=1 Tax=Facklamia sp. 7083-14-GEN3 TaxID=2973478 RepID=UPI00215CE071|nr:hypothetical protein [Facklamia sp. 7083-14-GEN3]MCR8969064.1 hypothetical protein [Facklamia sp. 7083-14-GEN3]
MFNLLRMFISLFFFLAYYLLMDQYFQLDFLQLPYLILTLYFVIAAITFSLSEEKISQSINSKLASWLSPPSNILLPIIYIFSPIILLAGYLKGEHK